jgi:signal transduction histidine kinase
MRLAHFLDTAHVSILDEAVAFARTIPVLSDTEERVLRDHLPELLKVISADLSTPQSRTDSIAKSHGFAASISSRVSTPTSAQTHGLMRAKVGLTIEQLVAEYRALRSSVLRLWGDAHAPGPETIEDITRFNEAIDQAIAESVQFYAQERERWRSLFLGVLGHDLRGPLNALSMTVQMIRLEDGEPTERTRVLMRGVKRMTMLLDSLLEHSRSDLGVGMTLQRVPSDLGEECAEEIALLRAAHPTARIDYRASGDLEGEFDVSRVREALTNLVSNAVKHGEPLEATIVRVEGDEQSVRISVENAGEIPSEEMGMLFEPLYQRSTPSLRTDRTHLGLGLFIVRQIARAHEGEVLGTCIGGRVRFVIELPKVVSAGG